MSYVKGVSKGLHHIAASPTLGAGFLASGSIKKTYFSTNKNDANQQLFSELFHSVDGTQVSLTQMGRKPTKHFEPQTIANFIATGLKAQDLTLEVFIQQRANMEDNLYALVVNDLESDRFGPSFSSSLQKSKDLVLELNEERKKLE